MRYFLLISLLLTVAVISVAGFRGGTSRKPPIEIFPDMDRQQKLRPQEPNAHLPGGISSQPYVTGTVPRATAKIAGTEMVSSYGDSPLSDTPVFTGREVGKTNLVETIPVPVTEDLMARGRERYGISCQPCHGAQGDGNGITKKLGMAVVATLHDKRIVLMSDGELFHVITHGRNLMGGYGQNITSRDRWAIVAYVRALQLTKLGRAADVPVEFQRVLAK
jgi:mono/diheme cytochrome c family protein